MLMLRPGRRHGIASSGVHTDTFSAIFNFFLVFFSPLYAVMVSARTDTNVHVINGQANQHIIIGLINPALTALCQSVAFTEEGKRKGTGRDGTRRDKTLRVRRHGLVGDSHLQSNVKSRSAGRSRRGCRNCSFIPAQGWVG
ncbi:hypothetical protein VTH06DRAFT_616 [Thermothelomyces fergusii]